MQKTSIDKPCEYCGIIFKARPRSIRMGNAKYCSTTCYHAARWGHTGKCHNCGQPANTKFCTPECQKKFWNNHEYLRSESRKNKFWEDKKKIIGMLGGKCSRCGIDDIRVLDINHKDPSLKDRNAGNYNGFYRIRDWSKNIGSIELLCANCHRIHTWEQMNYGMVNGKSI